MYHLSANSIYVSTHSQTIITWYTQFSLNCRALSIIVEVFIQRNKKSTPINSDQLVKVSRIILAWFIHYQRSVQLYLLWICATMTADVWADRLYDFDHKDGKIYQNQYSNKYRINLYVS